MDPEEIAKLVKNLKLSQDKNKVHVLLESELACLGRQRLGSCLVGKVFSSKAVNRETFRTNMPRILQAKKDVAIEMVGENLFSLDFMSPIDKHRALTEGPWNFFKDLVIFAEPTGLQNPHDISFTHVPLWVQFHNLPIAFMQPTILRKLGEKLGQVIEVEAEGRRVYSGKFARLRILKNIDDPLEKGLWVSLEDSEEQTCILILYENLPYFCYACGRLGHLTKACEDKLVEKTVLKYDCWLRAPTMPAGRSSGNVRRHKLDSYETTDQGGNFESPSLSNPKNLILSTEKINTRSDDRDHDYRGVESESRKDPMEILPILAPPIQNNLDIMGNL